MEVNICAENVADAVAAAVTWQYTGEVIQERSRLNGLFVANDLHGPFTLLGTAEFTVVRNPTNVKRVTRRLISLEI